MKYLPTTYSLERYCTDHRNTTGVVKGVENPNEKKELKNSEPRG
jgi:hypothetical protein